MREPPWKNLVEQLKGTEPESAHVQRLAARLDVAAPEGSLQRQLVEEMVQALRRSEAKVTQALKQLQLAQRDIETAATPPDRNARVAAYNIERERALHARWELMIHREALGFRRHDDLEHSYPIPPRVEP